MLFDTNIIIYSAQIEHPDIRQSVKDNTPAYSAVSYVEVLGFTKITEQDKQNFAEIFSEMDLLPVSQAIIEQAALLKQQKKMSLGDAIIAATCLVHGLTLVTRNAKDFDWIAGLTVHNPFAAQTDAQT